MASVRNRKCCCDGCDHCINTSWQSVASNITSIGGVSGTRLFTFAANHGVVGSNVRIQFRDTNATNFNGNDYELDVLSDTTMDVSGTPTGSPTTGDYRFVVTEAGTTGTFYCSCTPQQLTVTLTTITGSTTCHDGPADGWDDYYTSNGGTLSGTFTLTRTTRNTWSASATQTGLTGEMSNDTSCTGGEATYSNATVEVTITSSRVLVSVSLPRQTDDFPDGEDSVPRLRVFRHAYAWTTDACALFDGTGLVVSNEAVPGTFNASFFLDSIESPDVASGGTATITRC